MNFWVSLLTVVAGKMLVDGFPIHSPGLHHQPPAGPSEADQLKFAEEYLQHFYGYQPDSGRQKRAAGCGEGLNLKTRLPEMVKKMQKFFGLPPSGEINEETLAVMKKPRCGLSDVERFGETFRWNQRTISYRINKENLPFPLSKVRRAFRAALKLWSNVALIRFHRRRRREADIEISFPSGDHGDWAPFDGRGGILAHAFLPSLGHGGDVHFDGDEDWSMNSTGTHLHVVAAHEFGHALGLPHSHDPGAVMFPAYSSVPNYDLQLSYQDVKDIQHLYGVNPNFKSLLQKTPPPRTPEKCDPDLSFNAVTKLQQEVVFFKDRFLWRKHPNFRETGISLITSLWSGAVPPYLDAAYENIEMNYLLFFKGDRYWKLRQTKLQEGFPRNISDLGFPSRIKSVDAVLHFRNEQYTIFFTGHECWRYNEQQGTMEGSPMLTEQQWPGIPTPIDAAVFYEGFVNFFKGNRHYKYNFTQKRVVSISRANSMLDCKTIQSNEMPGA